jgi:phosphoribosylformylglycinamidine cyclo-ligase
MGKATYKDAGVDLDVYREAMSRLPGLLRRTFTPRVIANDGGFAGLFQLDFDSKLFARNYEKPVMIACTDGVGTKLKVAQLCGRHDTVGIDLVAMCVNDAICCGAEPLFFLDYIALAEDNPPLIEALVKGISDGCVEADCALLGGETAIMPDLYAQGDYDLAGFCVGVVEKSRLIDGKSIAVDDVVLGVASLGLHSNGFSLARKVVFEIAGLGVDDDVDVLGQTVGEALLAPTKIYTRAVRSILEHYKVKGVVHGLAHITGGGLHENIERILPDDAKIVIDWNGWEVPPVFGWLQSLGEIDDDEMARVFNMGIGLAVIVSPYYADSVQHQLADFGLESWPIGHVVEG